MARLDIKQLSDSISKNPDPFQFNLYLTIMNNGRLSEENPFKTDRAFLMTLMEHYEAEENYELCVQLIKRVKLLP